MMQLYLMTAKHLWRRLVSLLQLSPCTLEVVLCHSLLCFFIQSPGRLVLQDKTEDNQRGPFGFRQRTVLWRGHASINPGSICAALKLRA